MAIYQQFLDSSKSMQIEVEDVGPAGANAPSVAEFISTLQNIGTRVAQQMNELEKEHKPTDLSISFGLKALSTGGFAIGLENTKLNFYITMKWNKSKPSDDFMGI